MSAFYFENGKRVPLDPPQRHPTDQRFHDILAEMADLHDKKALDYGQDEDPLANVRASEEWGMPAWVGAMVRLTDKVRRLQALADKGELANEGAIDSFNDIAVYAVIARVLYEQDQEKAEYPVVTNEMFGGTSRILNAFGTTPLTTTCRDPECKGACHPPYEPPTVAVKDDFYDSTLDLLDPNSEAHREWRKERGYIDPPIAHSCSECGAPIDGYCPACGLEY